jgi:hypothetical protein
MLMRPLFGALSQLLVWERGADRILPSLPASMGAYEEDLMMKDPAIFEEIRGEILPPSL